MKLFLLTTFILQTLNGQLSVTQNLTPRECKIIDCQVSITSSCMGETCDENGNIIYSKDLDGCIQMTQPTDPVIHKCVQ